MNPAIIIAAIDAASKLITFINSAIAAAKRSKEWTPEQEADIDSRMEDAFGKPHWQPEKH